MARPLKDGLDYFPHDTNAFEDVKIQKFLSCAGWSGLAKYWTLVELIYKQKDAKYDLSDDYNLSFLIKRLGFKNGNKLQIFLKMLKDFQLITEMSDEYKILTSDGIQKRFEYVMNLREKYRGVKSNKTEESWGVFSGENSGENGGENSGENGGENSGENSGENGGNLKIKENKRKKETPAKIPSPKGDVVKGDFISLLLGEFCDEYMLNKSRKFIITNEGKERSAIGKLIKIAQEEKPGLNTDGLKTHFRELFHKCLTFSNEWHSGRMSPSHILSQYNVLMDVFNKSKEEKAKPSTEFRMVM